MRKHFSVPSSPWFSLVIQALLLFPLAASATPAPPAELREWTFLIFMNGNNNLDSYGADDLNELEVVGSTNDLHVVVQWASLGRGDVRRMYVTRDQQPSRVGSIELSNLGRVDMGDWHELAAFVEWGVRNFPARRYFVDVWNHGSGWHRANRTHPVRDISHDEVSGNAITTVQLAQAMQASARAMGHKVDLYGSDACLMGMLEVASQMADAVEYFVGSEELEPGPGWAYDALLREWMQNPQRPTVEVAKILTRTFVRSYQNGSQGRSEVTLSAFDLTRLSAFEHAFAGLAQAVVALPDSALAEIRSLIPLTFTFYDPDYADVGDFLDRLEDSPHPSLRTLEFQSQIWATRQALRALVVGNETTPQYARAQGAAFWLPDSKATLDAFAARYSPLIFERTTGWLAALRRIWQ